ncbi:MAG: hypothetical protein E6R02_08205 [Gammaproteobacteria bacterium]|nr:MAG: hypothetical protein E6R02_08205 [Gammaproteobacteria bacterium]
MSGDVTATRAKVQQYLTKNFSDVNVDSEGNYSLRHGSTRIFIRVMTRDEADWTAVNLEIPVLLHVKETPAVFEYVALHADDYMFGHLYAARTDEDLMILLAHTLLGDYLDEDELCRAVAGMLGVADDLDDKLAEQFGGDRFHGE